MRKTNNYYIQSQRKPVPSGCYHCGCVIGILLLCLLTVGLAFSYKFPGVAIVLVLLIILYSVVQKVVTVL